MRRASPLIVAALLSTVWHQACQAEAPELRFVRDLADVAGCRFLGPVRLPVRLPAAQNIGASDLFRVAEPRPPELRGATHLYVVNHSAVWGGATAFGAAYQCEPQRIFP